jgi:uncharacterized protein YjbI with pentapeptide repeats
VDLPAQHLWLYAWSRGERAPRPEGISLDFSGMVNSCPRLQAIDLRGANFQRANLAGAHFVGADLSHANFSRAKLYCADMRQVNLSGARLSSCDLGSCVLCDANLAGANLAKALLTRADLTRVDLGGANLKECDLRAAKGLTVAQIQTAKNWQQAIYDETMARELGLEINLATARGGRKAQHRE